MRLDHKLLRLFPALLWMVSNQYFVAAYQPQGQMASENSTRVLSTCALVSKLRGDDHLTEGTAMNLESSRARGPALHGSCKHCKLWDSMAGALLYCKFVDKVAYVKSHFSYLVISLKASQLLWSLLAPILELIKIWWSEMILSWNLISPLIYKLNSLIKSLM